MTDPTPPLRPRALRPRARVALVAPGGPVDDERIERSLDRCRDLELEPVLSSGARSRRGYLAGPDDDRLAHFQRALDDPTIDAVWALRGGYGAQRIVDRLDLARQRRSPIPFIGFSDNTTIHARQARLGVVSFHGPHPGGDFPPETERSFYETLFVAEPPGKLHVRAEDPPPRTLRPGTAEGQLIGGNLALLASLCGTRDAPSGRGAILFLEDVGEPAYRVDRMMVQLVRSGALEGVAGLALGRFTQVPEGGEGVEQVLAEAAAALDVPAVADLPFGHVEHNCTLPVGARARLDAGAATLSVLDAAVAPPR